MADVGPAPSGREQQLRARVFAASYDEMEPEVYGALGAAQGLIRLLDLRALRLATLDRQYRNGSMTLAEIRELRALRADGPPPDERREEPARPLPLTAEETERLAFLGQLMTRSGRFDNYEPTPQEARDYDELRWRVAEGSARP